MLTYFKKHRLPLLLVTLALFTILRILVFVFLDGYYLLSLFYILGALLFIDSIRYALVIGCAIVTITSLFRHQHKLGFTISWIFLALLGLIPDGHFQTLGALLSIRNADPKQFRDNARMLMNEYEPMTHFGYFPERPPLDKPLSKDKLSSSLLNANIEDVLVLENYVFVEKHGLSGLFRGYVVFKEGFDIWKDEPSIILQDGCSTCWKIRIVDGLYWFHAEPYTEDIPTYTFPLK